MSQCARQGNGAQDTLAAKPAAASAEMRAAANDAVRVA